MAQANVKTVSSVSISAVVTRADGTVEDLGTAYYYSRNPLRRWVYALGKLVGIWRR